MRSFESVYHILKNESDKIKVNFYSKFREIMRKIADFVRIFADFQPET